MAEQQTHDRVAECPSCSEHPGSTLACLQCGRILAELPGADHFARLGVPAREPVDLDAAETCYLKLSRLLHPDYQAAATPETQARALRNSALLNEAWKVLTDDQLRGEYLVEMHDPGVLERHKTLNPAFLMEAMEISEELEQAHSAGCAETVERIAERARSEIAERMDHVAQACSRTMERIARSSASSHDDTTSGAEPGRWNTERIATLLHQARVLRRILRDTGKAT